MKQTSHKRTDRERFPFREVSVHRHPICGVESGISRSWEGGVIVWGQFQFYKMKRVLIVDNDHSNTVDGLNATELCI